MVKKSLHDQVCFNEIKERIYRLSTDSPRKWGRMNASQMLAHCDLILRVPLKKIDLPALHPVLRCVGILAKMEMQLFNNGIPCNMPTFQKVIVNFECKFEDARENLLHTLDEYRKVYEHHNLPGSHALFGKMKEKDWGFLEYKHLDHHLKQFSV